MQERKERRLRDGGRLLVVRCECRPETPRLARKQQRGVAGVGRQRVRSCVRAIYRDSVHVGQAFAIRAPLRFSPSTASSTWKLLDVAVMRLFVVSLAAETGVAE